MTRQLKNGRSKLVKCDGQVLKTIILAKGFKPFELAMLMGYDRTYFNKCIRTNTIGVKAVEKLTEYKILPSMYDAELEPTEKREVLKNAKEKRDSKIGDWTESKTIAKKVLEEPVTRLDYDYASKVSPAEMAMEEPGVVKVEFSLDIVKLKAIIKAAVKEAYEEL